MVLTGFSRRLITRGKDKGLYIVTDFYKCKKCDILKLTGEINENS